MATRAVRLENLEREVTVIGNGLVGEALRRRHAEVAKEKLAEEQAKQSRAFGAPLPYLQAVDGVVGASLAAVKPGGVIRFDFSALREVVVDAQETLFRLSPVGGPKQKTRRGWPHYRDAHLLFIDGTDVREIPALIRPGSEIVFVNPLPYSRRIELGWSKTQAPSGVYDVAERELRRRWSKVARIDATYRGIEGAAPLSNAALIPGRKGNVSADRYPALVIKSKTA